METAELGGNRLWLWAHARTGSAACPRCGCSSGRVHSSYRRRLADAAIGGRPVRIRLGVRRFFCGNPDCPAVTFAEQVDGLTSPAFPADPADGADAGLDRAGPGRAGGGWPARWT